jgi:hypothetical protein
MGDPVVHPQAVTAVVVVVTLVVVVVEAAEQADREEMDLRPILLVLAAKLLMVGAVVLEWLILFQAIMSVMGEEGEQMAVVARAGAVAAATAA